MSALEFDAEHGVVAACALAPAGADLSSMLASASGGSFSWDRAIANATAHQIRPQFAAHLLPLVSQSVNANPSAADLAADARACQGHGQFIAGALIQILDALRAAAIPAVPFKGPAFATFLGAGPGSREMADLDILIRPTDIASAVQALAPLGYAMALPAQVLASHWLTRVTPELPLTDRHDSLLLELHWRLSPHWFPAPCMVDDVMGQTTEKDFFGHRINWPAAEELFLVHVADGLKSCGNGLRWIADIVRILRHHTELDWEQIRKIAARHGGLNSVRVALAVADDLTGDVAGRFGIPALALSLPPAADLLAQEARRASRLAGAARSIRERLRTDDWLTGAIPHFRWALQIADHPGRVAFEIGRYLAGPAVADLAAMPKHGESDLALRLRALRRRALPIGRGTGSQVNSGSASIF